MIISMGLCEYFFNNEVSYIVWRIDRSETEMLESITLNDNEIVEFDQISNRDRRLQWLASRVALEQILRVMGRNYCGVYKDDKGKPFLINNSDSISISHCADHVIIAVSDHTSVGVDIQKPVRNLDIVKTKFLSVEELAYSDLTIDKLCVLWSVKEAVYKAFSSSRLSLKTDVWISDFILQDSGNVEVLFRDLVVYVYYRRYNEYMISVCTDKKPLNS